MTEYVLVSMNIRIQASEKGKGLIYSLDLVSKLRKLLLRLLMLDEITTVLAQPSRVRAGYVIVSINTRIQASEKGRGLSYSLDLFSKLCKCLLILDEFTTVLAQPPRVRTEYVLVSMNTRVQASEKDRG